MAAVNSFGFLEIDKIKHPDRDEWAIPYEAYVLSQIPDGPVKDGMASTVTAKFTGGYHKTSADMKSEGWF